MGGKGAGKKRNRAAQSEQHGYQEHPEERAGKPSPGKTGTEGVNNSEKQRVLDKLKSLQQRQRDRLKESEKKDAGR